MWRVSRKTCYIIDVCSADEMNLGGTELVTMLVRHNYLQEATQP